MTLTGSKAYRLLEARASTCAGGPLWQDQGVVLWKVPQQASDEGHVLGVCPGALGIVWVGARALQHDDLHTGSRQSLQQLSSKPPRAYLTDHAPIPLHVALQVGVQQPHSASSSPEAPDDKLQEHQYCQKKSGNETGAEEQRIYARNKP